MGRELRRKNVAAVALTAGFLRSEAMLDHFGVSEANWQDASKKEPNFMAFETPAARARGKRHGRPSKVVDVARVVCLRH